MPKNQPKAFHTTFFTYIGPNSMGTQSFSTVTISVFLSHCPHFSHLNLFFKGKVHMGKCQIWHHLLHPALVHTHSPQASAFKAVPSKELCVVRSIATSRKSTWSFWKPRRNQQDTASPHSFPFSSQETLTQSPQQAKVCSPEAQGTRILNPILSPPKRPRFDISTSTILSSIKKPNPN